MSSIMALRSSIPKRFLSAAVAAAQPATVASVPSAMASNIEDLTRSAILVVDGPKNVGRKAIAAKDLKTGMIINEFSAPVFRQPTMHTVCLTNGVHVPPTFGAEFISHACGPDTNINMVVQPDTRSVKVVVTKDTEKGADLYFNYNTTEWTMSCPFQCTCHVCMSEGKSRLVRGFAYLSTEEQDDLLNSYVSAYVRSLAMKQRKLRVAAPATDASSSRGKANNVSMAL